jgi:molecular chaperone Hsp33
MDSVRRFLFEDLDIRGAIVALGNTWHELSAPRDDPPAIAALMGELAAVTALVTGNLKAPGRLKFQLQGHGAISLLLMDCDEQLRLRGTVRHNLAADESAANAVSPAPTFSSGTAGNNVTELLGDGQLVLTLQANAGQPYQSIVPLVGDSLAAIFEHYLVQSEQQPARLLLTANANFAGGLFLQKLPGADAKDPDGWNRIEHLFATLRPEELADPVANLLMRLFPEENIRLFDPRPVRYHCPRDEEKVLSMLKSLGQEEISTVLAERGEILVEDDICHHSYRYGAEIIPRLFD